MRAAGGGLPVRVSPVAAVRTVRAGREKPDIADEAGLTDRPWERWTVRPADRRTGERACKSSADFQPIHQRQSLTQSDGVDRAKRGRFVRINPMFGP